MRRLTSIAAFALFLAVPVWAQHGGGGHAGGFGGGHGGGVTGHSAGFTGRAGGSFGGSHSSVGSRGFSGMHSLAGFSRGGFSHVPHTSFSHGTFLHEGFHHPNHIHTHFFTYGFRNNCNGFNCGWRGWNSWYPWWGSAYYDPWWSWNQSDQQFDNEYYGQYQAANEMNQQSLEQQRMFREEEQAGDQDVYAPRRPQPAADPPPRPEPEGQSIISPTVLVFRDRHRQEVHNYAIVGTTLWNFAPAHTEKISLAQLDLPATEKVNEDRGVSFRIPGNP
jgi:hypothetical protein